MIEYPNKLDIIFDKLNSFNIKPIIIGGYIRDFLLKIPSKDIDIELYGLDSYELLENILQEFGSVNSVGKSFGVCKLNLDDLDLDFSLPRRDSKVDHGHKGFVIQTDKTLDFVNATRRRDFTMNAIGYDVFEKKILDPYHGIEDLHKKVLRAVDVTSFGEDPLRVLRAVQFAARYDLKLDNTLLKLCTKMINNNLLNELPSERIYEEIKKLLLKSKTPSNGFLLLKKMNAFHYFDEFTTISDENFMNSLRALDLLAKVNIRDEKKHLILSLSLLSYYFSKDKSISFITKLTSEKKVFTHVNTLLDTAKSINFKSLNNYTTYQLATKISIEDLLLFLKAICVDEKIGYINELEEKAKKLNVLTSHLPPLLEGKDLLFLKLKPSKEFSKILKKAYDAQMREEFCSHDEAIGWLKRELHL